MYIFSTDWEEIIIHVPFSVCCLLRLCAFVHCCLYHYWSTCVDHQLCIIRTTPCPSGFHRRVLLLLFTLCMIVCVCVRVHVFFFSFNTNPSCPGGTSMHMLWLCVHPAVMWHKKRACWMRVCCVGVGYQWSVPGQQWWSCVSVSFLGDPQRICISKPTQKNAVVLFSPDVSMTYCYLYLFCRPWWHCVRPCVCATLCVCFLCGCNNQCK